MKQIARVDCPVCGASGEFPKVNGIGDYAIHIFRDLYGDDPASEWRVCTGCGFLHQNPRPPIDVVNRLIVEKNANYGSRKIPQDRDEILFYARAAVGPTIDYAIEHSGVSSGTVFDVGAGDGSTLLLFEERGFEAHGVEACPRLTRIGREILKVPRLQQGIFDGQFDLGKKVDLVYNRHYFEHAIDLHESMLGIVKLLKPGGMVFTSLPTYRNNRTKLSLAHMNASHYSMFSHRSLNNLYARYGLEEVSHTYRGRVKDHDELLHVARLTGVPRTPTEWNDDAAEVVRYVNEIAPRNAANLTFKLRLKAAWLWFLVKLFAWSPGRFWTKLRRRLPGGRAPARVVSS